MYNDSHFEHYLSYGATDQQTVRALTGTFDGILVPGTVAAFQREGTGGFVLSLSATSAQTPYVIDPRFPLFQQALEKPKKSHSSLAGLFHHIELVRTRAPGPDDFSDDLVQDVAKEWVNFNSAYHSSEGSKFDKYAKRLGEQVTPSNVQAPLYLLAPYLVADGAHDPWWRVSDRLFEETRRMAASPDRCIRVLATQSVSAFATLVRRVDDDRIAIWVSSFDEQRRPAADLAAYAVAIRKLRRSGVRPFALYGGFFAVLLYSVGLCGASHGIGFGEQRSWVELPESGPAPARYYLPQLHCYVQPDEATRLFVADRRLAECNCAECQGEPPLALDYHALMRHSVRCRAREIEEWSGLSMRQQADRLADDGARYRAMLHSNQLSDLVVDRTERRMRHMQEWESALRECEATGDE